MKVLPFCAVCKEGKGFWFHYEVNKEDLKEAGYNYHEFEPAVSLKDVVKVKEEALRLVKKLEERDERLAKEINVLLQHYVHEAIVIKRLKKVVKELTK